LITYSHIFYKYTLVCLRFSVGTSRGGRGGDGESSRVRRFPPLSELPNPKGEIGEMGRKSIIYNS